MSDTPQNINSTAEEETGPYVYQNWKAFLNGVDSECTYEFPLYSDAQIIGEYTDGLGPYQLLNGIAIPNRSPFRPGVVLRARVSKVETDFFRDIAPWVTDTTRYHGGNFEDEVTALISLSLGIRVKAGPLSREFRRGHDPLGRPIALDEVNLSALQLPRAGFAILPYTITEPHRRNNINLCDVDALRLLPDLTPSDATALVIAARTYQNALLVAEGEPELAWLLFVSAIETAAAYWKPGDDPPLERLKAAKPELYDLLIKKVDEQFADEVAEMIAPSLGVTSKFIRFILVFLPEPPAMRPPEWAQIDWSRKSLKIILRKIYDYRSKALHTGRPFPLPMCERPFLSDDITDGFPSEKPHGAAIRAKGATWTADDTPILLHPFEYIVRRVLLNWCALMAQQNFPIR